MAGEYVKTYSIGGPGVRLPPDYARSVAGLSDADLEDEILGGKGEAGYQLALVQEQERRARSGPPQQQPRVRAPQDADEWAEL